MNDKAILPLATVIALIGLITGMVIAYNKESNWEVTATMFALVALPAFLGFLVGKYWREEK